jgi:hypothetical protein
MKARTMPPTIVAIRGVAWGISGSFQNQAAARAIVPLS